MLRNHYHYHNHLKHEVISLRQELLLMGEEVVKLQLRLLAKAGFDPRQPRAPAGSLDGGQWVDSGGGSSSGSSRREPSFEPNNGHAEEVHFEDFLSIIPAVRAIGVGGRAIRTIISGRGQVEEVIEWTFGSHKSAQKWQNRMNNRGWTLEKISETISKGKKYPAKNIIDGKNTPATRYEDPKTGKFVVVDDETKELLQISGDGYDPPEIPIKNKYTSNYRSLYKYKGMK